MNSLTKKNLPTRFGFLLVNDFTLISLSSAVEPLRMANRISKSETYTWKTISETGQSVTASDGLCVNVDCGIADEEALQTLDAIIVCGGRQVEKNTSKALATRSAPPGTSFSPLPWINAGSAFSPTAISLSL